MVFFIQNFCYFKFRSCLTSGTSATSGGAQRIFSKLTFLKSVRSNEKEEVSHSFLVDIFTKSLNRGGVTVPWLYAFQVKNKKTKTYKDSLAFARYTIMIRGQEMSQKSPVYKTEVLILHYILEKMPISIQFTNKPHLSTAVAWREKK